MTKEEHFNKLADSLSEEYYNPNYDPVRVVLVRIELQNVPVCFVLPVLSAAQMGLPQSSQEVQRFLSMKKDQQQSLLDAIQFRLSREVCDRFPCVLGGPRIHTVPTLRCR